MRFELNRSAMRNFNGGKVDYLAHLLKHELIRLGEAVYLKDLKQSFGVGSEVSLPTFNRAVSKIINSGEAVRIGHSCNIRLKAVLN